MTRTNDPETYASHPGGPPSGSFELAISKLNSESFPHRSYSCVDDVLVYALFAAKRRPEHSRALGLPPVAGLTNLRSATPAEGISICKMCQMHVDKNNPTLQQCHRAATDLIKSFPTLFLPDEGPIVEHLLLRYFLLYSSESNVRIAKTLSDSVPMCGLKASKDIPSSTSILSACGSMSSDLVPSIVSSANQSSLSQDGPHGLRMILGPFRFVNHDCNPNCEIMPIGRSNACTIVSLKPIKTGKTITVSYTASGDHGSAVSCQCGTCRQTAPKSVDYIETGSPSFTSQPVEIQGPQPAGTHKRTRRGGRRGNKKRRKLEQSQTQVVDRGEVEEDGGSDYNK